MVIKLTKTETENIFQTVLSELKCIVNEYDDDTGRCPSKKRIADGKYAESIMKQLEKCQSKIPNTDFINLDNIEECTLELDKRESSYIAKLLQKNIGELSKAILASGCKAPYTGVVKVFDDAITESQNVLSKMAKSA